MYIESFPKRKFVFKESLSVIMFVLSLLMSDVVIYIALAAASMMQPPMLVILIVLCT